VIPPAVADPMTAAPSLPPVKQAIRDFQLDTGSHRLRYGMGCAWLGSRINDPQVTGEDRLTLEAAYAAGFRYFDTSQAYLDSEVVVGQLVAAVPRGTLFLATKSTLPAGRNHAAARDWLQRNLDASLRRLQTDYLDLFQLHDFESMSPVLADGVLELLEEAKRQGIIRFAGSATRSHSLLAQSLDTGAFDAILTYGDYSLANRSAAALIDYANACAAGVINGSPLLCLPRQRVDLSDPNVLAAALQFPLTNSGIDITLTGPANRRQLESSLHALQLAVDPTIWGQWGVE